MISLHKGDCQQNKLRRVSLQREADNDDYPYSLAEIMYRIQFVLLLQITNYTKTKTIRFLN